MTTILPFVIYSSIPIGAVVIWLVARSVMRSEIRASNQLVERRRKEWRAGGRVGPKPGKYRGPERSDWRGWFAGGGPGMGRRRRRRLRRRRQLTQAPATLAAWDKRRVSRSPRPINTLPSESRRTYL